LSTKGRPMAIQRCWYALIILRLRTPDVNIRYDGKRISLAHLHIQMYTV
jgi:hypothetical protein